MTKITRGFAMDNIKIKFPALPLVLCAIFAVLARITGVAYSFLATDVMYSGSIICEILPSVRQTLSYLSFAAAACSASGRAFSMRSTLVPATVYAAVLFADGIFVILYDLLTGVLEGRLFLAILYRLEIIIYFFVLFLVGVGISRLALKRNKSIKRAVALSAALPPAISFVMVIWSCVDLLIEVDFLPYSDEVFSMSVSVITVLIAGALSVLTAVLTVRSPVPHSEKQQI